MPAFISSCDAVIFATSALILAISLWIGDRAACSWSFMVFVWSVSMFLAHPQLWAAWPCWIKYKKTFLKHQFTILIFIHFNSFMICDLHSYFLVVISAFPCYFVAFCQRFIYEYMDMDMEFITYHCIWRCIGDAKMTDIKMQDIGLKVQEIEIARRLYL